ncbi:hypothetical protein [Spiroplasma endosymbiont of Acasis viretata]|uniref:hypothetical protein n=1 Tax=Spiroplasma endosymbiont of Acasis viretata TaxID=3066306 RepID=UPI00313CE2BA
MPWEPYDKWSQAEKDSWKKRAEETNKAWGESKEKERREIVANALGFEKEDTIKKEQEQLKEVWTEKQKVGNSLGFKEIKKINNKASTSKGQSSSSKSQKM